ncbi:hypothetical protein AA12_20325 [Salmonella enterica subsp. enterica serovar Newport]|nr:hypothetical protein [Salmonella enterica subsp. enterica serovar Newport]ECH7874672.1 hypothetical protein [Salmonella enterica subsp. enterica serovar Rubislaw]EDM0874191.1 hypothetical protein [Salmonella enterica]EEN6707823.1 hypothetical protein [Salmonella enterica subsp. enterica serovar Rubislaw]
MSLQPFPGMSWINDYKVLAEISRGGGLSALAGGEHSTSDHVETAVTGSVRANNGVLSPFYGETDG